METTTVFAPAFESPSRGRPMSLAAWYAVALIATSLSTFAYLLALRRVAAHDSALQALVSLYRLTTLFAPVVVAIKGAAFGGVLWAALAVFDVRASYRRCVAAVWSAEFLLAAPQLIYAGVALLRGATTRSDLYVPLGVDLIWTSASGPFSVLSHALNALLAAWMFFVWTRLRADARRAGRPWVAVFAVTLAAAILVALPILQLGS